MNLNKRLTGLAMKQGFKLWILCLLTITLSGCTGLRTDEEAALRIDKSIDAYRNASSKVQLGEKKEKVLSVLMPTQVELPLMAQKEQEAYFKGGKRIEIYYFRSKRYPDGLTTDDEFTPYVFTDGVLSGIGWHVLGGPKSVGQTTPETQIDIDMQKEQQPKCTTIYTTSKGYQTICQ